MKVAIVNYSGNVGKTTIARHLLQPRMNKAEIFAVETINADAGDNASRGKEFIETQIKMALVDDAICDIGSSNIEQVIQLMAQNPGSHEDFDYFVIPVTPQPKQQRDTISTIEALAGLGVAPSRIRVLFNQVDLGDKAENVFSGLFEYQKSEEKFTIRPDAVIHSNPLYPKLANTKTGVSEIIADKTDYKEKGKAAKDAAEKLRCAQMLALQRGAAGVITELDNVYQALFR
ncbi:MAG: StbB family protein [Noviherbaspirillum sp.]